MKKIMILVLVSLVILAVPNLAGEPDKETIILLGKVSYTPYQDEYEKIFYPTVRITTPSGTGSGVLIDVTKVTTVTKVTGCYIITAAHVVDKENTVNIELYNSIIITGTVVITDTGKDLALIKPQINTDFTDKIYTAQLSPKDYKAYLFAPVWAVGCSLGLKPRPSFGHITYIEKSNPCLYVSICGYEISAPVLPGNSGGPVYDARTFEVIGIAVWVKVYDYQLITTMAGIVPINQIYEFLEEAKSIEQRAKSKD